MKLVMGVALAAALVSPAMAAEQIQQVLYNVSAAEQCSMAAQDATLEAKDGLAACNLALSDPNMTQRAALFVDRGVILVRQNQMRAALDDYNAAIAIDGALADAYVSRAGLLADMKRYDEARKDIETALALNTASAHAAYYTLGVIAEETGDARAAYRHYSHALALKPDYGAAQRELARFRTAPRT